MEQLRKSSYIISTRLHDGKTMWIHGYTGAIDIVSARLADYLDAHDAFAPEDFPFGEEVFARLAKRGYLTTKTKEEEQAHVAHVAGLLHEAHKKITRKGFGFIVTYNCNFRCPYCVENGISHNGQAWSDTTFTKELVDRAFSAMLEIEPRQEVHRSTILLYGGEPLLKEKHAIVSYLVQKGHDLNYNFHAITNGFDLDVYEDLLSKDKIASLQISLDGDKEYHNARRIHREGIKTFDKIIDNIGLALARNVKVAVRINTDVNNFCDIAHLQELFQTLGYIGKTNFRFYSGVLQENADSQQIEGITYQSWKQHVEKLYAENNGSNDCQDSGLFEKILHSLQQGSNLDITSAACSSQYASYLFDPQGSIYTCLKTIGKPEHVIGQYIHSPIVWTEARKHWFDRHVGTAPNCKHCKYALLCGGGCLARASYSVENGFGKSVCLDYASILQMAVRKAYKAFCNN